MLDDPIFEYEDYQDYEDCMLGLCDRCFTMKDIPIGETSCSTCVSLGGARGFEPEPHPKKSGPNSVPEE